MFTQLRFRLTAGSRLALALACVAVIALPSAATASAATASAASSSNAASAAVGAVYTQTNNPAGNAVVAFDRYADGSLVKRETVATGGLGSGQSVGCGPGCPILDSQNAVVVSKNGKLVIAVNAGSDTISSFRETNGGLELVDQESSGGDMPESLALHNHLLYVLNVNTPNANGTTGNISGFEVSPHGELTPIPGSSRTLPHAAPPEGTPGPPAGPGAATARAIEFSPTGKVLVVTELVGALLSGGFPGAIVTFVVDNDGLAGPAQSYPSSAPLPFGFAFDNNGHIVVSEVGDPSGTTPGFASSYAVSKSGVVTPIDTEPSQGLLPCWVAITGNGRFAYVVNTGVPTPPSVAGFAIEPSGELTSLGPPTLAPVGDFARTDAAVSRDGKYLYVLAPQIFPFVPTFSRIDVYSIGNDGGLTYLSSTPASDGLGNAVTGVAAS